MTGKDKTVIVIDDQEFVRGLVSKMMLNQGFSRILEASDGRMALDMLLDTAPDLVICDILMRPMDGLSFLQVLRENYDDFEHVPVIFMTNDASSEIVLKAMSLGASGILVKPVSPSKLEEQVRIALDPAAQPVVQG